MVTFGTHFANIVRSLNCNCEILLLVVPEEE